MGTHLRARSGALGFVLATTAVFGAGVCVWLLSLVSRGSETLRARGGDSEGVPTPVVYFASIARLQGSMAARDGGPKETAVSAGAPLGLGFTERLSDALRFASASLQGCRSLFDARTGPVRFEVKADARTRRLRVVGILSGMEQNAKHAACLRDKLEAQTFAFLSDIPSGAADADYRLEIDVLPAVTAGEPVGE